MHRKIVFDESVNYNIIKHIDEKKFEVISILKSHGGVSDKRVLEISIDNKAILITEDSDFGKWVFAHNQRPFCVLFLRYDQPGLTGVIESILKILSWEQEQLSGKFIVISPDKIRIRTIID